MFLFLKPLFTLCGCVTIRSCFYKFFFFFPSFFFFFFSFSVLFRLCVSSDTESDVILLMFVLSHQRRTLRDAIVRGFGDTRLELLKRELGRPGYEILTNPPGPAETRQIRADIHKMTCEIKLMNLVSKHKYDITVICAALQRCTRLDNINLLWKVFSLSTHPKRVGFMIVALRRMRQFESGKMLFYETFDAMGYEADSHEIFAALVLAKHHSLKEFEMLWSFLESQELDLSRYQKLRSLFFATYGKSEECIKCLEICLLNQKYTKWDYWQLSKSLNRANADPKFHTAARKLAEDNGYDVVSSFSCAEIATAALKKGDYKLAAKFLEEFSLESYSICLLSAEICLILLHVTKDKKHLTSLAKVARLAESRVSEGLETTPFHIDTLWMSKFISSAHHPNFLSSSEGNLIECCRWYRKCFVPATVKRRPPNLSSILNLDDISESKS